MIILSTLNVSCLPSCVWLLLESFHYATRSVDKQNVHFQNKLLETPPRWAVSTASTACFTFPQSCCYNLLTTLANSECGNRICRVQVKVLTNTDVSRTHRACTCSSHHCRWEVDSCGISLWGIRLEWTLPTVCIHFHLIQSQYQYNYHHM